MHIRSRTTSTKHNQSSGNAAKCLAEGLGTRDARGGEDDNGRSPATAQVKGEGSRRVKGRSAGGGDG